MQPPTSVSNVATSEYHPGSAYGDAPKPSVVHALDLPGTYANIDVGDVVDVKGALSTFRGEKQIKIERLAVVKSTAQEVEMWERRSRFRLQVLDNPWVLSEKEIRRCRKESRLLHSGTERKKKRPAATSEACTGYINTLGTSKSGIRQISLGKDNNSTDRWRKKSVSRIGTAIETSPPNIPTPIQSPGEKSDLIQSYHKASKIVGAKSRTASSATLYALPSIKYQKPATVDNIAAYLPTSRKKTAELLLNIFQTAQTTFSTLKATHTFENSARTTSSTMVSRDIFDTPVDTKPPPSNISIRHDHPVRRKGIQSQAPLQTNKFYSNFFLGDQRGPSFTFPYSVAWAGGKGGSTSWGMSCSHVEEHQRVFGDVKFDGASSYYLNPIGIQSMVISAKELGNETTVSMDSITAFSARVHLSQDGTAQPSISFPLVQGMAYITAQFDGSVPLIQSGVFFKAVTRVNTNPKEHVTKYNFHLEDETTWRVYAWRTKGEELDLKVINNSTAESKHPFYGILQVCKDPVSKGSEEILDDGAGIYPVTVGLSGSAFGQEGSYKFKFQKGGHQLGHLYMFALPHHISSFNGETMRRVQEVRLQSTTKGVATLVRGTEWTMVELHMPTEMDFAPWHPEKGPMKDLSNRTRSIIRAAAAKELSQNMVAQINLDSMYFSGKVRPIQIHLQGSMAKREVQALAKFATILYVVQELLGDEELAKTGLGRLKAAFGTFAANKQKFPLFPLTAAWVAAWGGIVSSASYVTGDAGVDFGNTYYNDHHFHYGYFILAAATIGHLDPEWAKANKDYVNLLVRDVANPSEGDKFFPLWRSFDWYHGHSWAHGLYAAMDGKDQESSSEDTMCAYALKMWGRVSQDSDLEMRGNLQLSIISRSLQSYYLYKKDNTVQPEQFIGNKVAGILFENKVDHSTYFDSSIEAIQGIHMIPILAATPFVRDRKFVREEWEAFFDKGRADSIRNAWKGIVYGNYATIEPRKAWEFFASRDFDPQWLDGGASMTWFMAYSAALGCL
ncbi:glycosyl hydrolase [Metarhizium album ARSEF 1941]|uniref:glucan endo-1,3-beta-D-glucosidase n=1 Tax=Metarhizium album (strain ARSEF 1941) TaxID=1081103 RepID=A0A0B2X611_METAS|nr:glycosyl hydrolase [Metarhizium album ARSEF 1941]KHO01794.1 glycosyl hydrolase [Metarhizium album ARSEF 1941]